MINFSWTIKTATPLTTVEQSTILTAIERDGIAAIRECAQRCDLSKFNLKNLNIRKDAILTKVILESA